MKYWLMKSEPDAFSIDDLAARPQQTEPWNGVRNYQVRNMFRDEFKEGDLALFYHSNCRPPGVVGTMRVVSSAYPDPTQFDSDSEYYDSKSKPEEPRWLLVDVKLEKKWSQSVSLNTLRQHAEALSGFKLLAKGSRLSVVPVSKDHWDYISQLAGEHPE